MSSACLSLIITYFYFVGRNADDWLVGWCRYSCYYACVKVVATYYHKAGDCDEMEERKNLMSSLNELVNLVEQ